MQEPVSPHRKSESFFLLFSALFFCVAGFVLIFIGKHHVDEGYYHLIAHLTSRGDLPYRDYFYVQTPLFPFVYGLIFKVFGSGFFCARATSLFWAVLSLLVAGHIAMRQGGRRSAAATAGLIACVPFTIYYLTIVKLYALTAFWMVLAVWALTALKKPTARYSIAAGIMALGVATRLTLAPAIPVLVILAAIRTRRITPPLAALLTATAVLTAILLPCWMAAPDTFAYDIAGYHFDKESFSGFRQIFHRLDVVSKLIKIYFLQVLCLAAVFIFRWSTRTGDKRVPVGERDAAWMLAAVILFHFTSQAPYIHRYLAMMIPPVAALIGPELVRGETLFKNHSPLKHTGWLFVLACALMLISGETLNLVNLRQNPYVQLKTVAHRIGMFTGPGTPILTFNNSVAVEANRPVLDGDEMNVLTYHPAWTEARCRKVHVLNLDMLEHHIKNEDPGAILLTETSFIGNFPTFFNPGEEGARPRIMAAIRDHYLKVSTFPGFGYMGEDADLYLPVSRTDTPARNRGGLIQFGLDRTPPTPAQTN